MEKQSLWGVVLRKTAPAACAIGSCSILILLATTTIAALPQYTAREGRICDSCHAYPFETEKQKAWQDPVLAERKCNLSCQTCHADPGGGGLRTVAGRYLANASLAVFNNEVRPYHDQKRNLSDFVRYLVGNKETPAAAKVELSPTALQPTVQEGTPPQKPAKYHTHEIPPNYTLRDPMVYGTAWQKPGQDRRYAPEFGVYGNLNADPLLQLGGDLRLAYVKTDTLDALFPMQMDLGARAHPVEHLSLVAVGGLVGQARSDSQRARSFGEMATVRSAYAMLNL